MERPTTNDPQLWIEYNRHQRVAEGLSLTEQTLIGTLAQVVLTDKISRALMGPVSSKGRSSFIFEGEPTEAEQHWSAMQAARKEQKAE